GDMRDLVSHDDSQVVVFREPSHHSGCYDRPMLLRQRIHIILVGQNYAVGASKLRMHADALIDTIPIDRQRQRTAFAIAEPMRKKPKRGGSERLLAIDFGNSISHPNSALGGRRTGCY